MPFHFVFFLLDDGEYALTRGGYRASEKCDSSKGNICQIATAHKGLFGYF